MHIKRLEFVNSDAVDQITVIYCDERSIEPILSWYGAFYAGDDYSAFLNGVELELDLLPDGFVPVSDTPEEKQTKVVIKEGNILSFPHGKGETK